MNIPAPNACLHYYPNFFPAEKALQTFYQLQKEIDWEQDEIFIYGKKTLIPRLQAWYGNTEASYGYSGIRLKTLPWTPFLLQIKQQISRYCHVDFNAVLTNYYRDQSDSVSWHSDDEDELGEQPIIASLSLGGERIFKFKHKITGEKRQILLESGSLLIMSGETQVYWQHCIPKSKKIKAPRINLTFRIIKK